MSLPEISPIAAALVLHIGGGSVSILAGAVALAAPKGRPVHRAAGTLFVIAMLVMAGFAVVVALDRQQGVNAVAGTLTLYLVATAWLTVRRPDGTTGLAGRLGFFFASSIAASAVMAGSRGLAGQGIPPAVPYAFAGVAALAAVCDLTVILRRGVSGAARIARHLWRMCAALFVASGSFFLGQMDEIPQALHGPHLFVLAFAPLAALLFWMIRVHFTRVFKSVPTTP